jgi:ubiquinone/menaquinone biosynthesis C-methylase UbiE
MSNSLIANWGHPSGLLGHLAGLEMSVGKRPTIELALNLLALADDARVVEVGCGPGVAIKALAASAPSGSVTGIDPASEMRTQARLRNRAAVNAGRVTVLAGSAEALPVDGTAVFTHYLSMYSVAFWQSVERGLREAHRVLVPGGRLVIITRPARHAAPASRAEQIAQLGRAVGFDEIAAGERSLGRRRVELVTARKPGEPLAPPSVRPHSRSHA